MEFDHANLTPLYRLQSGEPGQSHAIDIARRYGMPAKVIDFAERMIGTREADFHALLAELKEKRQRYSELIADLDAREQRTAERERLLSLRLAQAEEAKRQAMGKAFAEARDVVTTVKRETRAILDEARREKSGDSLKKLEKMGGELENKLREYQEDVSPALQELSVGDTVFVRSLGFDATIARIDEKQQRLRLKVGHREVEVSAGDVALKRGVKMKEEPSRRKATEEPETSHELRLLGLRVDEAFHNWRHSSTGLRPQDWEK